MNASTRVWGRCLRRQHDAWRDARRFWRAYMIAAAVVIVLMTMGGYCGLIAARVGL